ncbi:MAG: hypothetical protein SPJ19_04175 [Candidatus Borkfalkiaceae bacterium]|nr:hypothetical protein [Christensenellaceae bacterium]
MRLTDMFFNNSALFKRKNLITVCFDFQTGIIKLTTEANGKHVEEECPCLLNSYSDEFYKTLVADILNFAKNNEINKIRVNVVFPETAVVTDYVEVPVIAGKNIKNTLEISLCGLYKNRKDLFIKTFCAFKNKNSNTYFVSGIKAERVMKLKAACAAAKIGVNTCVVSSEATIRAFRDLRKDSKKGYIFADVKKNSTKLIFVYNGNAVCGATIPFGVSLLESENVVNVNDAIRHTAAETAVLKAYINALSNEIAYDNGLDENSDKEELYYDKAAKKIRRKQAESLVAATADEQDVFATNLKTFAEWIYRYIDDNEKIVSLINPSFIYVNVDKEYEFIIDKLNENYKESIFFCSAQLNNLDEKIVSDLSCYGGSLFNNDNGFNVF